MTEQEINTQKEPQELQEQEQQPEQQPEQVQEQPEIPNVFISPLKKRIDGVKEEYKRLFLFATMALMFLYSIYLLYQAFI